MISHTTKRFREAFRNLPPDIQKKAREIYHLWHQDPWHPGLYYKKIHPAQPIYSVRIGLGWRAVGVKEGDQMIWYWIGSHADYDNLITNW